MKALLVIALIVAFLNFAFVITMAWLLIWDEYGRRR